MEPSQFVLMVAVFMVIATVILSLPMLEQTEPEAKPVYPGYDCRFDSFYSGTPLTSVAAPTLRLIPSAADGFALIIWSDRPDTELRMIPKTENNVLNLSSPDPKDGLVSLTLTQSGAFTYDARDSADTPPTAKGTGTCIKTPTASGDQS